MRTTFGAKGISCVVMQPANALAISATPDMDLIFIVTPPQGHAFPLSPLSAFVSFSKRASAPPIIPTYSATYRAHVIALGRIRDRENGQPRHPVLDSKFTLVSDTRHKQA